MSPRDPGRRTALHVDPIACRGHGLCAEALPELITLDEWGYPILTDTTDTTDTTVSPRLHAHARRAVATCPALALKLRTQPADPRR